MTASPRPRPGRGVEGERDEALARLAAVVELHRATVGALCGACLLPHPCPTVELAEGREAPHDRRGDTSRDES